MVCCMEKKNLHIKRDQGNPGISFFFLLFSSPIQSVVAPLRLGWPACLHVLTGSGTGDNLDQFAGNGGLTLSVVKNLESVVRGEKEGG